MDYDNSIKSILLREQKPLLLTPPRINSLVPFMKDKWFTLGRPGSSPYNSTLSQVFSYILKMAMSFII